MLQVGLDDFTHLIPDSILKGTGVLKCVYNVLVLLVLTLLTCLLCLLACIKADMCAYGLDLFL